MIKNWRGSGVTNMDQRTCNNCKQVYPYGDWDLYCEKHKKWVNEYETCDDWEWG